jgi:hypothetical protein
VVQWLLQVNYPVGARLFKLWREPHAPILIIIPIHPHRTPAKFSVDLRSCNAQVRREWVEERTDIKWCPMPTTTRRAVKSDVWRVATAAWIERTVIKWRLMRGYYKRRAKELLQSGIPSCGCKGVSNAWPEQQQHLLKELLYRIAAGYGLDDWGIEVWVLVGSRMFSSLQRPDRLSGPPRLSNGYQGLLPWG